MSDNKREGIIILIIFLVIGGSIFVGVMSEFYKEKPIIRERIWGTVENVNGHYCENKEEPLDCKLVAKFGDNTIIANYRVSYSNRGYVESGDYDECWKALLLKTGDPVSAIKETWVSGKITYTLSP